MVDQTILKSTVAASEAAATNESADALSSLLVIEDAVIHSTIISRIAEQAGFATTTAQSFDAAAALLRQRKFDCVTLDLGLGAHAGAEVFRLLSEAACKAPVVIISGAEKAVCDATVRIGKSLNLDIWGPIRKPVDLKALRLMLAKIKMEVRLAKLATATH
jgi:DNA-binding response OmpR family regulator